MVMELMVIQPMEAMTTSEIFNICLFDVVIQLSQSRYRKFVPSVYGKSYMGALYSPVIKSSAGHSDR